jgi:hypothetical protein
MLLSVSVGVSEIVLALTYNDQLPGLSHQSLQSTNQLVPAVPVHYYYQREQVVILQALQ